MAFTKSQPIYHASSLLIILHLLTFWSIKATAGGLTVDLIHRDSPSSPFYNPSKTHFDRLHDAFRRSVKRINHFKLPLDPTSTIQTPIIPGVGEYLMNISIGTPPVQMLGIADTGSDLYGQCEPCIHCYYQTLPHFDPLRSSTYQNMSCQSPPCKYSYSYADGSYTIGVLAAETLTLGMKDQPVSLPNIVFGCGHDNGGTFNKLVSGVIGLGGRQISLISQLDQSVDRKFSYCLVPSWYFSTNVSSKITFGYDDVTFGSGAVTTPIHSKYGDTFYMLTLEAFSVGNKRIPYKGWSEVGNTMIDSGSTLTALNPEFFEDLLEALDETICGRRVKDPRGALGACYESGSHSINIPDITAHFKGADVKLQPMNTFEGVERDLVCLTMIASPTNFSIYGSLAQMNFLVGYDLEASTVSFLPTDCTTQ